MAGAAWATADSCLDHGWQRYSWFISAVPGLRRKSAVTIRDPCWQCFISQGMPAASTRVRQTRPTCTWCISVPVKPSVWRVDAQGGRGRAGRGRDLLAVFSFVLCHDIGRDAAAIVDLQAPLFGPVAYFLVLGVVCIDPPDAGWLGGGPCDLACRLDVALQLSPQLLGMLRSIS